MSTMNLGSALSLGKEARRLSLTESLELEDEELERLMGMKSASKYEEESKAKEKTVNHLITHAEKVINFFWTHPRYTMRGRRRTGKVSCQASINSMCVSESVKTGPSRDN